MSVAQKPLTAPTAPSRPDTSYSLFFLNPIDSNSSNVNMREELVATS